MAATGNNTGSRIFGTTAETSIATESFSVEGSDPGEVVAPNNSGQDAGFWHDVNPQQTVTISGETNGTSGVVSAVFGTAIAVANNLDSVGVSAGGIYCKRHTLSKSRTGMQTVEMEGVRKPLIA